MDDLRAARAALRKYFSIYNRPKHWIIECDKCDARWSLEIADGSVAVGNLLHLMNHARGHDDEDRSAK